jgi:hypothetical protein
MQDLINNPEIWVLVAFLIFCGILVYMGVPALMTKSLDERAERIRHELDEARRLREEAQALLTEYQKKAREAEDEAQDHHRSGSQRGRSDGERDRGQTQGKPGASHQAGRRQDRAGRSSSRKRSKVFRDRGRRRCNREDRCVQGFRRQSRRPDFPEHQVVGQSAELIEQFCLADGWPNLLELPKNGQELAKSFCPFSLSFTTPAAEPEKRINHQDKKRGRAPRTRLHLFEFDS